MDDRPTLIVMVSKLFVLAMFSVSRIICIEFDLQLKQQSVRSSMTVLTWKPLTT